MTVAVSAASQVGSGVRRMSPRTGRLVFAALMVAALVAGFVVTGRDEAARAAAQAGPELTRLMRAMAALKALMVAAAVAGMLWRLRTAAGPSWLAAYVMAAGAMVAGPGLIWDMAHVRAGALLLHGGLFASAVLLWRDPAVGQRLAAIVSAQRSHLRQGGKRSPHSG